MKRFIFISLSILISSCVFANNLQLQKVSLADTNRTAKTVSIKMNISWEHSWRDNINWDAAWIIIKYKEPKDSAWKWKHASLSTTGNDIGTGSSSMKIVVPADLMGAFFYRSAISSGNVSNENVKLFWNYGAAGVVNIDSVEVRVFATEMVYVPQGGFCLGDGNGTTRSDNSFQLKSAPNNYAIINDKWSPLINTLVSGSAYSPLGDESIVYNDGIRISGLNGLDVNNDKISDFPNFPTGYKSYYTMKYKVTQGQYTDFLNTVCANDTTSVVLNNYISQPYSYNNPASMPSVSKPLIAAWLKLGDYMTSAPTDLQRHTIAFDIAQAKFTVSRPDRGYSLMNTDKILSFSEWFGLRPMSELEFEKTARGPLPAIYNEKSWGDDASIPTAFVVSYANLTMSGTENGTEYFTNYDITKRNYVPYNPNDYMTYVVTGGDGGKGPYRVGIYANDTSSRVSSGAGYYGVMDLSKISSELVIPVSSAANRTLNYNSNGKGMLSALGSNYSFSTVIGTYNYSITRNYFTSRRGPANTNSATTLGGADFHAVRSAPSDN